MNHRNKSNDDKNMQVSIFTHSVEADTQLNTKSSSRNEFVVRLHAFFKNKKKLHAQEKMYYHPLALHADVDIQTYFKTCLHSAQLKYSGQKNGE